MNTYTHTPMFPWTGYCFVKESYSISTTLNSIDFLLKGGPLQLQMCGFHSFIHSLIFFSFAQHSGLTLTFSVFPLERTMGGLVVFAVKLLRWRIVLCSLCLALTGKTGKTGSACHFCFCLYFCLFKSPSK